MLDSSDQRGSDGGLAFGLVGLLKLVKMIVRDVRFGHNLRTCA